MALDLFPPHRFI